MATTRATGKACRLAFSWIVTLAGFDPTPAEEITDQRDDPAAGRGLRPAALVRAVRERLRDVPRVLGEAGAERLHARLGRLGRSFEDLLDQLRRVEPEAAGLVYGVALDEIPEAAIPAIGRVLDRWGQDAVTDPGGDLHDSEIPF